jgi:hypothetical protein
MGIVGLKHKKRYRIRCADCGSRVRVAHPLAIYCSAACKQHAARKRRDEKEKARVQEILARMEQREWEQREADRQRQLEAERKRREDEWEQRKADRQRQREAEREAAQERRRKLAKYIPVCECGAQCWRFSWDKKLLRGWQLTQTCNECGCTIKPTISPCPCVHHGSSNHYYPQFTVDGDGVLTCLSPYCKQEYVWGEWIGNWKPGQQVALRPGHTLDKLKRPKREIYYSS